MSESWGSFSDYNEATTDFGEFEEVEEDEYVEEEEYDGEVEDDEDEEMSQSLVDDAEVERQRKAKEQEDLARAAFLSPSSTFVSPNASRRGKPKIAQNCKTLAVLGTVRGVGKSTLVAGIGRIISNNRMRVAPFQAQHTRSGDNGSSRKLSSSGLMPPAEQRKTYLLPLLEKHGSKSKSRKSSSSRHGGAPVANLLAVGYGEISHVQAVQAEACRIPPRAEMTPITRQMEGDKSSLVVLGQPIDKKVAGKRVEEMEKDDEPMTRLAKFVLQAHQALSENTAAHVIVLDGTGSCADELIPQPEEPVGGLSFVRKLECPWLLVASADAGGVVAQVVGTKACVTEEDWEKCQGVIINRIRGDPAKTFPQGSKIIEKLVGKPVFVVPCLSSFDLLHRSVEQRLENEDMYKERKSRRSGNRSKRIIVIVGYPHTALSEDLISLEADDRFDIQWRRRVLPARPYPHTTAVILPATRLTRLDMKWLHNSRWTDFLQAHIRAGGKVLGLGGGYHMLGHKVFDPQSVLQGSGETRGLDAMPIETVLEPVHCKETRPARAKLVSNESLEVQGFSIHGGQTTVIGEGHTFKSLLKFTTEQTEGLTNGQVSGTCFHGVLRTPDVRRQLLVPREEWDDLPQYEEDDPSLVDPLDRLAEHLEASGLDFDTLLPMISSHRTGNSALNFSLHY